LASVPVEAVMSDAGLPRRRRADVAQLAERVLGKDEVTGSIPVIGSRLRAPALLTRFVPASQQVKSVAPSLRGSAGGREFSK
jgi:hypothetical protein